jgi:hypothetical protein
MVPQDRSGWVARRPDSTPIASAQALDGFAGTRHRKGRLGDQIEQAEIQERRRLEEVRLIEAGVPLERRVLSSIAWAHSNLLER